METEQIKTNDGKHLVKDSEAPKLGSKHNLTEKSPARY